MEQFLNMNRGLTETKHIVFTEKESSPFHSMILLYYVEEVSFRTLKDNAVHHLTPKNQKRKTQSHQVTVALFCINYAIS